LFVFTLTAFNTLQAQAAFYEFAVRGCGAEENFIVFSNIHEVISKAEQLLTKPEQYRQIHIMGTVLRGNGGFNGNWNWHIVPATWDFTSVIQGNCNMLASEIEEAFQKNPEQLFTFCSRRAFLLRKVSSAQLKPVISYHFSERYLQINQPVGSKNIKRISLYAPDGKKIIELRDSDIINWQEIRLPISSVASGIYALVFIYSNSIWVSQIEIF
jgi:hypothetical protein